MCLRGWGRSGGGEYLHVQYNTYRVKGALLGRISLIHYSLTVHHQPGWVNSVLHWPWMCPFICLPRVSWGFLYCLTWETAIKAFWTSWRCAHQAVTAQKAFPQWILAVCDPCASSKAWGLSGTLPWAIITTNILSLFTPYTSTHGAGASAPRNLLSTGITITYPKQWCLKLNLSA